MRCFAVSTADTYDIQNLSTSLEDVEYLNFYTDSLHISYKEWHVFVFSYGCVVFWNVPLDEEEKFLTYLEKFSRKQINPVYEESEYTIGTKPNFFQGKITLAKKKPLPLQMLAISYGISQAIKLAAFEASIDNTIESTKNIPEELAYKGKISLSRKEISKRIGALFIERTSVNLHSDILDAPVFVWDHPEYEDLYTATISDLEVHSRTSVLNSRLDIVKELFEMMRDELTNRHSTILELTIIILIMIEVFLTLFIHVFHLA